MHIYRRSRGLGLVALWAFAPAVTVQTDTTTGELRFSVGAGVGEYARVTRGCEGEVLDARTIPFTALGFRGEYEADRRFRMTVYGGGVSVDDPPAGEPAPPGTGSSYVGGQAAYEGGVFGFGLGAANYAMLEEDLLPSFHLRVGSRAGTAVVLDVAPPTTMPGVTGLVRGGVSFRRDGGFGGVAGLQTLRPFDDNEGSGPFVELSYPVRPGLELELGASVHFGSNDGPSDWATGLGVRFTPWRR